MRAREDAGAPRASCAVIAIWIAFGIAVVVATKPVWGFFAFGFNGI
jgi:hypothetical protein